MHIYFLQRGKSYERKPSGGKQPYASAGLTIASGTYASEIHKKIMIFSCAQLTPDTQLHVFYVKQ